MPHQKLQAVIDASCNLQVTITLLSSDGSSDHTALAINAVGVALQRSGLPLAGSIAAVHMKTPFNRGGKQHAAFNLLYAGSATGPIMMSMKV